MKHSKSSSCSPSTATDGRPQRIYGYYCLPVLAGDRLVARFDLKADRKTGRLRVLSRSIEERSGSDTGTPTEREAARSAIEHFANALGLSLM